MRKKVEVNQILVTIEREEGLDAHQLSISKLRDNLNVTCPTSIYPQGKKLIIEIEKGEEYGFGAPSGRELDIAMRRVEKATALADAQAQLKIVENEPLRNWFGTRDSKDNSPDYLVVEYDDKGNVVLTNESEKNGASVKRIA